MSTLHKYAEGYTRAYHRDHGGSKPPVSSTSTPPLRVDGRVEEFVANLGPDLPFQDLKQAVQFLNATLEEHPEAKEAVDQGVRFVNVETPETPGKWTMSKLNCWNTDLQEKLGMYLLETPLADSRPDLITGQTILASEDGRYVRLGSLVASPLDDCNQALGHEIVGLRQGNNLVCIHETFSVRNFPK